MTRQGQLFEAYRAGIEEQRWTAFEELRPTTDEQVDAFLWHERRRSAEVAW